MSKIEIEKKFLIDRVEEIEFDIKKYPKKRYVQGYISTNPTIRLRDQGGKFVLCIKSDGTSSHTLVREEFEMKLSKSQFEKLWKKVETNAVTKDRYFIPIDNGLTAELDIYHGELSGLVTVEVEFDTLEGAEKFVPPEWFGKDVTGDSRYKNTSLSVRGLPE